MQCNQGWRFWFWRERCECSFTYCIETLFFFFANACWAETAQRPQTKNFSAQSFKRETSERYKFVVSLFVFCSSFEHLPAAAKSQLEVELNAPSVNDERRKLKKKLVSLLETRVQLAEEYSVKFCSDTIMNFLKQHHRDCFMQLSRKLIKQLLPGLNVPRWLQTLQHWRRFVRKKTRNTMLLFLNGVKVCSTLF